MQIKRTRPAAKPAPRGFTDAQGYKTADAPKRWPFGMLRSSLPPPRPMRGALADAIKKRNNEGTLV